MTYALQDLFNQYGPTIDEWYRNQKATEEMAAMELADMLFNGIKLDGKPLSEILGGPEAWVMRRRVLQSGMPTSIDINWNGPSPDEI